MDVQVLYFAAVADLVGQRQEQLSLPTQKASVADVVARIVARHPVLQGRLGGVRVALNEAFTTNEESVEPGDTIALIPPVSGG